MDAETGISRRVAHGCGHPGDGPLLRRDAYRARGGVSARANSRACVSAAYANPRERTYTDACDQDRGGQCMTRALASVDSGSQSVGSDDDDRSFAPRRRCSLRRTKRRRHSGGRRAAGMGNQLSAPPARAARGAPRFGCPEPRVQGQPRRCVVAPLVGVRSRARRRISSRPRVHSNAEAASAASSSSPPRPSSSRTRSVPSRALVPPSRDAEPEPNSHRARPTPPSSLPSLPPSATFVESRQADVSSRLSSSATTSPAPPAAAASSS